MNTNLGQMERNLVLFGNGNNKIEKYNMFIVSLL